PSHQPPEPGRDPKRAGGRGDLCCRTAGDRVGWPAPAVLRSMRWLDSPGCHKPLGILVYGTNIGSERIAIMKVFVAGGSGAMGRRLVPQLVAGGYEVVAMTRDEGKASWLRRVGAQPVGGDALDGAAVAGAVGASEPEVVIHQLTALTGVRSYKNFDKEFALTNRLRTEGTDNLLKAAQAAGVRRIVAQSYGNWNYERTGSALNTEQDAFDPHPPANQGKTRQATRC